MMFVLCLLFSEWFVGILFDCLRSICCFALCFEELLELVEREPMSRKDACQWPLADGGSRWKSAPKANH